MTPVLGMAGIEKEKFPGNGTRLTPIDPPRPPYVRRMGLPPLPYLIQMAPAVPATDSLATGVPTTSSPPPDVTNCHGVLVTRTALKRSLIFRSMSMTTPVVGRAIAVKGQN